MWYIVIVPKKKPVFKDEKFAERMKEFGIGILENGNRQLYKLNDEGFHQAFVQTYSKWFDAIFLSLRFMWNKSFYAGQSKRLICSLDLVATI